MGNQQQGQGKTNELPRAVSKNDVTSLDISQRSLSTLPKELLDLPNIETLVVSHNQLADITDLSILKTLTSLDVSNNLLVDISVHFCELKSLRVAILNDNYLKSLPDNIGELVALEELNVSNNNLSTFPAIVSCKNLTVLNLASNQLTEVPQQIVELKALEKLFFQHNQISQLPAEIGSLPNLLILNFTDNQITKLPLSIGFLSKITKMYFDHNTLQTLPPTIGQCKTLKELFLNDNDLIELPSTLANLPNLYLLDVTNNSFQDDRFLEPDLNKLKQFLTSKASELKVVRAGPLKSKNSRKELRVITTENPKPKLQNEPLPKINEQPLFLTAREKLWRFRGQSLIFVDLVDLSASSLTESDVFLLDSEKLKSIYVWCGSRATLRQIAKAQHIAKNISQNTMRPEIVVLEGKHKYGSKSTEFFTALRNSNPQSIKKLIKTGDAVLSDSEELKSRYEKFKFYCFSLDPSGKLKISVTENTPLLKSRLQSSNSYVIDSSGDIYVWCGLYSDNTLKNWAALKAEEILEVSEKNELLKKNEASQTLAIPNPKELTRKESKKIPIIVEPPQTKHCTREILWNIDGMEMWDFKELFFDWMDNTWDTPELRETEKKLQEDVQKRGANSDQEDFYTDILGAEDSTKQQSLTQGASRASTLFASPFVEKALSLFTRKSSHQNLNQQTQEKETTPSTKLNLNKLQLDIKKVEPQSPRTIASPRSRGLPKGLPELPIPENMPSTDALADLLLLFEEADATMIKVDASLEVSDKERAHAVGAFNARNRLDVLGPSLKPKTVATAKTLQVAKRASLPSQRKKPTKNPIRQRIIISNENSKNRPADHQNVSTKARSHAGGYGLLWSLGVTQDQVGFTPKRETKHEDEFTHKAMPRLIQVKGRRKMLIRQVQVSAESLNEGDVFILDTGKRVIYQWNGCNSNRIAKGKAMDLIKNIKDKEFSGVATVKSIDQGKTDVNENEFWQVLGGKPKSIMNGSTEDMNDEIARKILSLNSLYRIVETEEGYIPERMANYPLTKNHLKEEDCYILDCITETFVWCGKKSSVRIRQQTVNLAKDLKNERKIWTAPISRELPEAESVLFREKFSDWGYGLTIQVAQPAPSNVSATVKEKIDVLALYQNKAPVPVEVMIDEGKNVPMVWRIEGFERVNIPKGTLGEFFSSESYIILYKYKWKNKTAALIYYWHGRDSTTLDQGTCALLTRDLNTMLQREGECASTKDMRVAQNLEPKHFISIFGQNYMVHKGKEQDKKVENKARLYEVSENHGSIRCIEVSCESRALKSQSTFLLRSLHQNIDYIWRGEISNEAEVEFAIGLVKNKSGKEGIILEEGKETPEFWSLFTEGKEEYAKKVLKSRFTPRLFHYLSTNAMEEIVPFCQDDLNKNDVFMLDAFHRIFVWQFKAHWRDEKELKIVLEIANEYIQIAQDGRTNCKAYYVPGGGGLEPLIFTSNFTAWDPTPKLKSIDANIVDAEKILQSYEKKFTYLELVEGNYPKGLDSTQLETYLEDTDFENTFKMKRDEFYKLPRWKQQELKREKMLF